MLVYVYSVQIKSNPHELAGEIIVSEQGELSPEERSLIARRLGIDWREELLIEPFPIGDNDSLLGPQLSPPPTKESFGFTGRRKGTPIKSQGFLQSLEIRFSNERRYLVA